MVISVEVVTPAGRVFMSEIEAKNLVGQKVKVLDRETGDYTEFTYTYVGELKKESKPKREAKKSKDK